jgi:hypothetical protein
MKIPVLALNAEDDPFQVPGLDARNFGIRKLFISSYMCTYVGAYSTSHQGARYF